MTEKEAIELLNTHEKYAVPREKMFEAEQMGIKALKKQMPTGWVIKYLDNFRKYSVTCPICNEEYIGNYDGYDDPYNFNYCPNCGQRLEVAYD